MASSRRDSEQISCPICLERFKNPKVLFCGHSLCASCVDEIIENKSVLCPECRTKTVIPSFGLPTNFVLKSLAEEDETSLSKGPKCSNCTNNLSADQAWICIGCKSEEICSNCVLDSHRGHELEKSYILKEQRTKETLQFVEAFQTEIQSAFTVCDQNREVAECVKDLGKVYDRFMKGSEKFLTQPELLKMEEKEKLREISSLVTVSRMKLEKMQNEMIEQIYSSLDALLRTECDEILPPLPETSGSEKLPKTPTKPRRSSGAEFSPERLLTLSPVSNCWKCYDTSCDLFKCRLGPPTIHLCSMSVQMKMDAIRKATDLVKTSPSAEIISSKLSRHFDCTYGRYWHCLVRSEDIDHAHLDLAHSPRNGHVIHFSLSKVCVLLFKSAVGVGCWKCGLSWCDNSCDPGTCSLVTGTMTATGSVLIFKASLMPELMKTHAKRCVQNALKNNKDAFDAAQEIREEFERKFGKVWQCVVRAGGDCTGGHAIQAVKERTKTAGNEKIEMSIQLKAGHVHVLLFKTVDRH